VISRTVVLLITAKAEPRHTADVTCRVLRLIDRCR